jgi:capsule polysaccharide export protein KpsE/RkpR
MNPNGFVLAASMTSQTSMPIRSKMTLSSLTSAMFTERKMFSRSLEDSATRELETATTLSMAAA